MQGINVRVEQYTGNGQDYLVLFAANLEQSCLYRLGLLHASSVVNKCLSS
jgi:hypothetical protein